MLRLVAFVLGLASLAGPLSAQSDSAAVVATIERFRKALASGDSAAAIALLAPDATILESGGLETVPQYRSHHLPADIAFAQSVPHTRGPIRVTVAGDVAWASSTSGAKGEFRGREINSASAELMVLRRSGSGWRIQAIHWSSRARR
ncbi:MAG: DUF4440 domain-containing protein [Vicinamibacterales bacterium]